MKWRMLKVLAIIMVAALAMSLIACGGSASSGGASQEKSETAAAPAEPKAEEPKAEEPTAEEPAAEPETPAAEEPAAAPEEAEPAAPAEGEGWVPDPADYELIDAAHFDRAWNLDSSELGTFSFDLTTHDPDNSLKTNFLYEWADMINKATDGGVTINIFAGGTLASAGDAVPAVEMGTADMAWCIGSNFPDVLPITTIFAMPGLGLSYNSKDVEVIWDLYDEYPQMAQEFEDSNLVLLHMYTTGTTGINSTKSITTLDDLKGLNIRTLGGHPANAISLLGASPIFMGPGDMYDSISKGVIDGYTIEFSGVASFKMNEVTNYYNVDPIYTSIMLVIMNLDSYNSLPPEYQEVINYYSGREMSEQMAYLWELDNTTLSETLADPSQIQHFEEAEYEKIKEMLIDYSRGACEDLTTPEFDAVHFMDEVLEKVEQYKDFVYYRWNE